MYLASRAQCEELRSTLSKREQDIVCAERLEQLRLKEEQAKEIKAHDDLYAQLWEKDRQEKVGLKSRPLLYESTNKSASHTQQMSSL